MRAVAIEAGETVRVVDIEPQPLGIGDVRVGVRFVGVCGSDLHLLHRDPPKVGLVLGHEFSGVVVDIGPGGDGTWSVGDRVTARPVDPCGECGACVRDVGVCMVGLSAGPGLGRQGAYAESLVLPGSMLRRLPDSVTDEGGALVEPLAVAARAVRRSGADPADAVCVLGAGPMGVMTVVALAAEGFTDVLVVDPNESRRKHAAEFGYPTCSAAEAVDPGRASTRMPRSVIFECTGHPSGMPLAIELVEPCGSITIVGVPPVLVATDYRAVVVKEANLYGCAAYSDDDFDTAIRYLATGQVAVAQIVTSIQDLSSAASVLRDLANGSSTNIKVLLSPN